MPVQFASMGQSVMIATASGGRGADSPQRRTGRTVARRGAQGWSVVVALLCLSCLAAADEPPPLVLPPVEPAPLTGDALPPPTPTSAPTPPPTPAPAAGGLTGFGPYRMQPYGEFHLLADGAIAVTSTGRERAGFHSDAISITCDGAVYNPRQGYIFAEGHVTVVEGLTRISCRRFYYDVRRQQGWAEAVEIAGLDRLAKGLRPDSAAAGARDPYLSAQATPDARPDFEADLAADSGLLPARVDNPEETRLLMLRTEKLWRMDATHFQADQATVTSSEMPDPEWSLGLRQVRYERYPPGEDGRTRGRVVGDQAVAHLFGLPLVWSPWGSYPVGLKGPFVAGEIGESGRYGTYGNLRVGFDTSDLRRDRPDSVWSYLLPRRSYLDVTPRSDRGMGGGATLRWEGTPGHGYDRLTAHIDGVDEEWISRPEDSDRAQRFYLNRNTSRLMLLPRGGSDETLNAFRRYNAFFPTTPTVDSNLELYRGDLRTSGYADLHLERAPTDELTLVADATFTDVHDPQYYEEYNPEQFRIFRSERGQSYDPSRWQTSPRAVDQAVLKGFWGDWTVETRYEQPAERFQVIAPSFDPLAFHQAAYAPEARVFLAPTPLWAGFVVEAEGLAGRVGQRYDPILLNTRDYEADRVGGRVLLSRPFYWQGFSVRPRVGVQATHYSRFDLGPEPTLDQAALLGGVEVVDRWTGRSNLAFTPLGLDGFDHIIELFGDYDLTSRPSLDPVELPGIDPWDDLTEVQVIRFGIRQSFLNHNPRGREDFARRYGRIELSMEGYPDPVDARRLLIHGSFDSLVGSFQWRPRSFLLVDGWARWWLYDGFLERTSLALSYLPIDGLRLAVRELHTDHDPEHIHERQDTVYLDAEWAVSRRWRLGYGLTYEFFDTSLVRRGLRYQHFSLTRDFGSMELGGFLVVNPGQKETHGLVSVKFKASRAQAWPVRDNRTVVREILQRDAQARTAKAAAAEQAARDNDRYNGGELGWMEREKPSSSSPTRRENKEHETENMEPEGEPEALLTR